MTEHTWEKHKRCETQHCSICDGGLLVCTVCRCIEGSLASECPGVPCYATHCGRGFRGSTP